MIELPEIVLPYGTTYVTVGEIPGLIAAALYPELGGERTVSYLHKAVRGSNRTALRADAEVLHRKALDEVILQRDLVAFTHAMTPASPD